MVIYCKQDGSVQSVPAVIPQGSLREPVTIIAPAPSAICSLRIMPASHEAIPPVIATGMEIDGDQRVYSLHLPPTVTEWAGVCRYQVMLTDANGRQTASYAGTFTVQRGAIDHDLLPANTQEMGEESLADLLTLLSGLQTSGISAHQRIDEIQELIDSGEIGGTPETDPTPAPQSINPVQSGGTYSAFSRVLALILAAALPSALASSFSTYISKADAYIRNAYYIDQPTAEQVAAYESAYNALRTALNLAPVTLSVNASGNGATVSPVSVTRGQAAVITITPETGKTLTEYTATMSGEELPSMTLDNGSVIVYTPAGVPATADISVTYTAEVRTDPLLSLTINGTNPPVYVYALPYSGNGVTISGSWDGMQGNVKVAAADGYILENLRINGTAVNENELFTPIGDELTITANAYRVAPVFAIVDNCRITYSENVSGGFVRMGETLEALIIADGGYYMTESGVQVEGLTNVTYTQNEIGLGISGTVSDNVVIRATATSRTVPLVFNLTNCKAYIQVIGGIEESRQTLEIGDEYSCWIKAEGDNELTENRITIVGLTDKQVSEVAGGFMVSGVVSGAVTITATASADTAYDYTIDDDGYLVITAAPYTITDNYIVIE